MPSVVSASLLELTLTTPSASLTADGQESVSTERCCALARPTRPTRAHTHLK